MLSSIHTTPQHHIELELSQLIFNTIYYIFIITIWFGAFKRSITKVKVITNTIIREYKVII
jgi:hypothetical protein